MSQSKTNSSMDRRQLLKALGGLGVTMLATGCGSIAAGIKDMTPHIEITGGGRSCVPTADDNNGSFSADGSNDAGDGNATLLDQVYSGSPIVRNDITSNDDGSSVISGVPLTLLFNLQDTNNSCEVLQGYYIYIWHCTPGGEYSGYTSTVNGSHLRSENYLRGIQATNTSGQANFTTIYPGWHSGRAVHIHVEIYRSLSDPTPVKTTQMAFPMTANNIVQSTTGYNGTVGMLANSDDSVFNDGTNTEMMAMTGNPIIGYSAWLTLRVAA